MSFRFRKSALLTSVSIILCTGHAYAQEEEPADPAQADEIIVTATKRASTIQDVPFS